MTQTSIEIDFDQTPIYSLSCQLSKIVPSSNDGFCFIADEGGSLLSTQFHSDGTSSIIEVRQSGEVFLKKRENHSNDLLWQGFVNKAKKCGDVHPEIVTQAKEFLVSKENLKITSYLGIFLMMAFLKAKDYVEDLNHIPRILGAFTRKLEEDCDNLFEIFDQLPRWEQDELSSQIDERYLCLIFALAYLGDPKKFLKGLSYLARIVGSDKSGIKGGPMAAIAIHKFVYALSEKIYLEDHHSQYCPKRKISFLETYLLSFPTREEGLATTLSKLTGLRKASILRFVRELKS